MIHKLSVILKGLSNYKFTDGFIKYLASLDFKEFDKIFTYYMKIIVRYERRYKKQNVKIFSKNWFINKKLDFKYKRLYHTFFVSNTSFVIKISADLGKKNKTREEIINNISDTKNAINNLSKNVVSISEQPTKKDIIKFNILMIDSIYLNAKLQKLSEELDNYKTI